MYTKLTSTWLCQFWVQMIKFLCILNIKTFENIYLYIPISELFLIDFLKFYFIFKLYKIVLVLPNIEMNPPQVYMCSPSWTLLPPPSPYHPSGSSQCTSPKHLVISELFKVTFFFLLCGYYIPIVIHILNRRIMYVFNQQNHSVFIAFYLPDPS